VEVEVVRNVVVLVLLVALESTDVDEAVLVTVPLSAALEV
jgi:hypothetical protein